MYGVPVEHKQVFLNLVGNPVQAMPEGGTLRLRVQERHEREGGRGTVISVLDTGSDIKPENGKQLFEPFFTTKSTKGTGLGLWVSRGIMQEYGGSIRFRSLRQPTGNVAYFSMFLPDTNRAALIAASAAQANAH